MQEIARQCLSIWREIKLIQKIGILSILLFIASLLTFLLFHSSDSSFVPLYSGNQPKEIREIQLLLEQCSIPFKEGKEGALLVPKDEIEEIRNVMTAAGLSKHAQGKGFELFDTNTWIKGEKELQVLEMRALKGQLETDLTAFEHIKSAHVILDLPPPKSFGNSPYKTKASVILTLMPGVHLSFSELRAISNHLSGAVRGLEPHMIAISDTAGKLYQALDPEGKEMGAHQKAQILQEELKEKIDLFLTTVVGAKAFFTSIQPHSIFIMVDQRAISAEGMPELKEKLGIFINELDRDVQWTLERTPFKAIEKKEKKKGGDKQYLGFLFFVPSVIVFAFLIFLFFKKTPAEQKTIPSSHLQIDLKKLAEALKDEDPQEIATMISYLEPAKAEKMIASFSEEFQEAILTFLEKEE